MFAPLPVCASLLQVLWQRKKAEAPGTPRNATNLWKRAKSLVGNTNVMGACFADDVCMHHTASNPVARATNARAFRVSPYL